MPQDPKVVRMLIVGAAFLTVTLALILLQPSASEETQVVAVQPTPVAPEVAPEPALDDADTAITRAATNLTEITPQATEESLSESDAISASVLAALGSAKPVATAAQPASVQTSSDDAFRDMTSSIVASLTGAKPQPAKSKSMEEIIVQALKQGQSDAYIDALLNEAASAGQINVPSALTTNEGRVDTTTLLATLVAKSTTGSAVTPRSEPLGEEDGVEVRVVQRAGETKQYNFYTVQRGDSLGAIAYRFYGDASAYVAIFNANRTFLSSPDQIRAGQRLTIPAVNSL